MQSSKIKIAVFTGSRSEYGLLRHLINEITSNKKLQLQLIVSGTHLSKKYGLTIDEITANNHKPDAIVRLSLDQIPQPSMAVLTAEALIGVSKAFETLKPHFLVVLGDRYEAYAAASAAHMANISICHLHGGETTEGAIDDRLRHAISQLSTWHFCAAEPYRKRILSMGHPAERVHNVGPMVLDALITEKTISNHEFEKQTGFRFGEKNLLGTFHPETLKDDSGLRSLNSLINSLRKSNVNILFTYPNSDPGHEKIIKAIHQFQAENPESVWFLPSLGQRLYLSALSLFDGMVGNSSSGIIEAPLLAVPTLNIGDRQKGRLRFGNIIEAIDSQKSIDSGLSKLLNTPKTINKSCKINNTISPSKAIVQHLLSSV